MKIYSNLFTWYVSSLKLNHNLLQKNQDRSYWKTSSQKVKMRIYRIEDLQADIEDVAVDEEEEEGGVVHKLAKVILILEDLIKFMLK